VLAGLLTILSSVAWSDVTFHLYANGTTNTSLSVAPGGTAALAVLMNADNGEQVVGVSYEVQLPMEGWTLTSREYGDYGWYEDDSNEPPYDGCVPHASGTPVVILNGTYTGGDDGTEVVLYAIEGGGHNLPGSRIPEQRLITGRKNNDINGAEVIWDFFKQHRRAAPSN